MFFMSIHIYISMSANTCISMSMHMCVSISTDICVYISIWYATNRHTIVTMGWLWLVGSIKL